MRRRTAVATRLVLAGRLRAAKKTPLYKIVSERLEGWLENRAVAEHPVSAHVERELRSYLTCGILCFEFGRARCTSCGQGFVVAFSCKGRGVCPSCNGRRIAQTAAHLVDRVIPPVPVRQWVISVSKRLRCFLADRPNAVAALTRILIEEIERLLGRAARPTRDGTRPIAARPHLGTISFLHRFGSALNHHMHKAANWVGPVRGRKSTRPRANGVVELSPFEFLDRLADLVPPPRKRRHRYHGVFAPNHKLRPAVTSLAIGNVGKRREAVTGGHAAGGLATGGCCDANPNQKPRSWPAHQLGRARADP